MAAVGLSNEQRGFVERCEDDIRKAVSTFILRRSDVLQRHSRADLLQEAHVAFCMGILTYLPSMAVPPEVYALGAVRLHLLRCSGQAWREITSDADVQEELSAEPATEDMTLMAKVLRKLSPAERRVIRLRYGLDRHAPGSTREVAGKMQVDEKWVRVLQKRAEANLARLGAELTAGRQS